MSTAVAAISQKQFTPEQMKLITDVVAKGATKDELNLFLYRCQNMGLDPLKPGMVHFIKYGNSPGTIVVGIEGFRVIAERTGKKAGVKRGVTKDKDGKLVSAWCEVYRSDWKEPAREEVPFAEYNTGKGPWSKMPETMLKKVAEAAALRMAFPDALGGVYIREEMDQAEGSRVMADQPGEEDGHQGDFGYRVDFGQWNRKTLEELYRDPRVGPEKIAGYIEFLEEAAAKRDEPLSPKAARFIKEAETFLGAMENAPLEVES